MFCRRFIFFTCEERYTYIPDIGCVSDWYRKILEECYLSCMCVTYRAWRRTTDTAIIKKPHILTRWFSFPKYIIVICLLLLLTLSVHWLARKNFQVRAPYYCNLYAQVTYMEFEKRPICHSLRLGISDCCSFALAPCNAFLTELAKSFYVMGLEDYWFLESLNLPCTPSYDVLIFSDSEIARILVE